MAGGKSEITVELYLNASSSDYQKTAAKLSKRSVNVKISCGKFKIAWVEVRREDQATKLILMHDGDVMM